MFFESSRASKRAPKKKAQEVPVADPDTKTSKVSQFETFSFMVAEATRNTKKMKPSQASIERWSGEVSRGRLPKPF